MKNLKYSIVLIIFTFFSISIFAKNETVILNEKQVLLDLYKSLNGENWNNNFGWNGETNCEPCNGWYGVECKKGKVVKIDLHNNNLSGNLPSTLNQLSSLKELLLGKNNIEGSIPSNITDLLNLEVLQLSNNQLSGELPRQISKLQNLKYLFLTNNTLEGEIPVSVIKLDKLKILYLGGNNFTGELPIFFDELEKLEALVISKNNFSIPEKNIYANMGFEFEF